MQLVHLDLALAKGGIQGDLARCSVERTTELQERWCYTEGRNVVYVDYLGVINRSPVMKDARSGRAVYRAGHLDGSRNVIQKSMQFGRCTARGNCARAGPQDSRHASHPLRRGGGVYAKDPREDRLEAPPIAKTSDDPSGNTSVQKLPQSHDTVLWARQQL